MAGLAFISYRREDTGPLAQSLYLQLKSRFGTGQLFMDVNSVPVGSPWPTLVQDKLQKATVVLAVIGPKWLTVSDKYGRRRLDEAEDWVRLELKTALVQRKPIIPLLVGHGISPPPDEALPDELHGLFRLPCMWLGPEVATWTDDMNSVGFRLTRPDFGLKDNEGGPDTLPVPLPWKAELPGLTEDQLSQALNDLPGWEPWQDTLPREYPHFRQELRKNFRFSSFEEAVRFMAYLAPLFTRLNHHPQWSNEWATVQIRLTTWDASNKITKEDVRAAHEVDQAHKEFLPRQGRRWSARFRRRS
jgi:pterin-4a-carbinolamine dehydratase